MRFIYDAIDAALPFRWLAPVFMKNALVALLVACPAFGALGSAVVSNRMAFFSDAIGHSALTGIALGALLGIRDPMAAMAVFALVLGFAIVAARVKGGASSDTAIGVFSSASVALGVALLSARGSFAKYQGYLVGDILSIQPREILALLASCAALAAVWVFFYNKMLLVNLSADFARSRGVSVFWMETLFALSTALVVAISIRWTGLLVVNSLLVIPAAAARMVSRNSRQYVALSALISLMSGVAGLAISFYAGAASGAAIALVNAAAFCVALALKAARRRQLP